MQESTVKLWLQNVQTISTYTTELPLHRERNKFRDVSRKIITPSHLVHQSKKRKVSQIIALLIFLAKIQIYPQHRSQSRHFSPDYSPNFRPPWFFPWPPVSSLTLPSLQIFREKSDNPVHDTRDIRCTATIRHYTVTSWKRRQNDFGRHTSLFN